MGNRDSKPESSLNNDTNEKGKDLTKGQAHNVQPPPSASYRTPRTHSSRIESNYSRAPMKQEHVSDSDHHDNIDDAPTSFEIHPIDLERQKFNPFMTDMRIYTGQDDIKANIDDNKQHKKETLIGSFEFGELFSYWDSKSTTKKYIAPEHKSLEDELTNNRNEFFLKKDVWDEFVQKAKRKYQSMYGNKGSSMAMYAKNRPYWNKLCKIKPGSKMSIDHILAVILYTDTDDLQRYFKEQTRKMKCNETVKDVAVKNRKYANWFRLLFEVVWLFGNDLKYNQKVYHGINCKLLFNKFQYDFNAPLSTTTDENVAANFCKDAGIVLELRNSESAPQHYFDVANFSRYPESEYLFFAATLKITSILMPDTNTWKYLNYAMQIDVLNFYMGIMNGNEIERYSSTHSRNDECHVKALQRLCKRSLKLILQHMKLLSEDLGDFDGGYMWKLFINFTKRNNIIWINKNKLRYLHERIKCKKDQNIDLVKQFIVFGENSNDKLGEYLKLLLSVNSNMKVLYATEWEWIVKEKELNELRNGETGQNGIACNDYWDYFIDNNKNKRCTFGGNMVVGFHEHNSRQHDEVKKVGFYWRLSAIPQGYESVVVSVELYCPQIEFYIQFFNIEMAKNGGLINTGNTSLFPISKLDELDTFKWRIIMKCTAVEK